LILTLPDYGLDLAAIVHQAVRVGVRTVTSGGGMSGWMPWLIGAAAALLVIAELFRRRSPSSRKAPAKKAPPKKAATKRAPTRKPPAKQAPGTRATGRPRAGEIWWADVPYEEGTGSKVRPCLVLRVARGGADVLKITSQDKSDRGDHVRIPTRSWDPDAEHDSFLDLTDPIRVTTEAFADRAGTCDPVLWGDVRKLHHLPGAR
jgi:hypothetical protein